MINLIDNLLKFSNEYQLKTNLIKENKFITPESYLIDNSIQRVQRNHNVEFNIKATKGAYVSMQKIFKQFFEISNIFNDTISNMENLSKDSKVSNFVLSTYWKNKILHMKSNLIIPFHMYFDDWEPDNALGSHKKLNSMEK